MYKNFIRVYCRLKPNFDGNPQTCIKYQICLDTNEEDEYEILVIRGKPSIDFINHKPDTYSFRFHKVFNEETNQEKIYDIVAKPVIEGVMQGFNGTIFAYGQTGSGKTFTISGGTHEQSSEAIVHRSMKKIFQSLSQTPANSYFIDISYMEIYNETGCDLLSERGDRRIILQEDEDGEIQLRNLSLHHVKNYKEFLELYRIGENNRSESSTILNQYSSRSHCILTIYLAIRIPDSQNYQKSKLHLVDLAGSERISKFGHPYQTLVEARHINLSLHYLEQVIVALGEKHRLHIPYRNSVMTTVLRDSLGGNCLTTMIATLSTHVNNLSETLSTCRFGQRVALVRNEIRKNSVDDVTEIDLIKSEFQSLKSQMSESSFKTALSGFKKKVNQNLSEEESLECQNFVDSFISGRNSFSKVITPMLKNPDKIKVCFEMLKSVIIDVQRKRKKAEQQAHFMYQRVLGSKQDVEFLKTSKSCVLPNKEVLPLFPKSSGSISTFSESNSEFKNSNLFSIPSESSTGYDKTQKLMEMKVPEACAHHKCIPSEIFEAKMNTLVSVIEECKEVHKKEISKLDSIKKIVVDDITINHNKFSDIITKINQEKLSKLRITKTESLSNVDNTDCDDISKSRDYNKEILLRFDDSKKCMKSERKHDVSKDKKYDTKFENTEKLNEDFECNFICSQIKLDESSQAIVTERKNSMPIFKTSMLPRYSRKNPNCFNDKLNTCSEPVVKCCEITKDLSGLDKTSQTRLNIGHKSQQHMTTETLQRIQQKGKFNASPRRLSPKRSILTNHRLEPKENVDFQNTGSISHYEGDSTWKKLRTSEKKLYDNTVEFKNFSIKSHTDVIKTSPYIPTCSEECCITNAVNNWRSLNETQNYCCTHISNSETAVKKDSIVNYNNSTKKLTNQYTNISEITKKKYGSKITENISTLSNRPLNCNYSINKTSNRSEMTNRQNVNKILLNSKSNKTIFQSDEEFSNFETDEDDIPFTVLNPRKMQSKYSLAQSSNDSFNIESFNFSRNNSSQKINETLPLTGDPDVDEEIIRFYQKQTNYHT